MKHRFAVTAVVAVLLAVGGVLWYLDTQHRFDVRTESFTFRSGGNELAATLALPTGDGPHGVVAFVHGDGDVNASHDGGYLPIWEALADAGYASVSWDKPGVGESTGDWLDQSMADRADEVAHVIEALQEEHAELDLDDIGVIGFSQAGWVLPLLPERIDCLKFVIAGSPAINWGQQGRYLTETKLARHGADNDLARRVRAADRVGDALLTNGDHANHVAWIDSLDDEVAEYFAEMSPERWAFVQRNHRVDATETLPALEPIPTMLLLAGNDDNVNVAGTEATYRRLLPDEHLDVSTYPHADHSLLDHDGFGLTMMAIFRPRAIFADGLLADIGTFAARQREDGSRCAASL